MTPRWILAALAAWAPLGGCATGHSEATAPAGHDAVESTVSDTRASDDETEDTASADTVVVEAPDTRTNDDEAADAASADTGAVEAPDTRTNDDEAADAASVDTGAATAEENTMKLQMGARVLTATLVDNSSTRALKALLAQGPLTLAMEDYGGFEKVGSLGTTLPRNDEPITTEAGDLILYQGSAFVIYYAPNSWNFTRLGKLDGVTAAELKAVLGPGSVSVTLSLE